MFYYTLARLWQAVPVIIGVSIIVFLMLHLIPGDPAALIAGQDASAADIENVRRNLGLDQPLALQYLDFVKRALVGDFGESFRSGRPVIEEIGFRYWNTMQLALTGVALGTLLGLIVGIYTAVKQGGWGDSIVLFVSLLGISMPPFFLGIVLMLVFSISLGWLPLSGKESGWHLILPALTLAIPNAAIISRVTRSSMLDVLSQDYVRTARSKGLLEFIIIVRHALRNALIPVVTVAGLQTGYLLGGAVVTETVFGWPGLGRLVVQAIGSRDYPVVQGAVLIFAITFVVINIITDLLYKLLDPRIKLNA